MEAKLINRFSIEAAGNGKGLLGDINGDGELTMKDVLIMRRYIAGLDELTDEQIAAGNMKKPNA